MTQSATIVPETSAPPSHRVVLIRPCQDRSGFSGRDLGAETTRALTEKITILYYEYMEAEGLRIGLKLLVVFLREDRYDGHLWFSSAELLEEAKR